MSKTKEQLLTDYKKSNKTRRIKIVEKAGFKTEQEYLNFIKAPKSAKKQTKSEEKPTIHNVYILDASGSMAGGKLTNAVAGINAEMAELQRDTSVNYTQTLIDFSSYNDIRTKMYKVPISSWSPYHCTSRDMTALNQAVGETLIRLLNDNPNSEKVLVKIFTDGQENDSTGPYRDQKTLSELIKKCESNGFTITFVGTERDVKHVVQNLNINISNTMSHDNTERGVMMAFAETASATKSYATKVLKKQDVSKDFYSKKVGKLD